MHSKFTRRTHRTHWWLLYSWLWFITGKRLRQKSVKGNAYRLKSKKILNMMLDSVICCGIKTAFVCWQPCVKIYSKYCQPKKLIWASMFIIFIGTYHIGMIKCLISLSSPFGVTDTVKSKLLPQITSFILLLWPNHVCLLVPIQKEKQMGKG